VLMRRIASGEQRAIQHVGDIWIFSVSLSRCRAVRDKKN
jgi:hypothetical protein